MIRLHKLVKQSALLAVSLLPAIGMAATQTNVGHYGSAKPLPMLTSKNLLTSKTDASQMVLINKAPYDVWFEIAGVTPDSPQLLKAAGSPDGHDSYYVDNVTRDQVVWVYSDYDFTQPKLNAEPTVMQNNGYSSTLYVFNNTGQ